MSLAHQAIDRPAKNNRVIGQLGFVLHTQPYKETSLIVDVFTQEYGRIALVAKGAKRPSSKWRGILQSFHPLSISWSGKSELRTLTGAEWVGGMPPLEKSALLCGFYLNEVLQHLIAREDPFPTLFSHYMQALGALTQAEDAAIALRKFELVLLQETGVAGDLAQCTETQLPVEANKAYVIDPERGARPSRPNDLWPAVHGETLQKMMVEDYSSPTTQMQSKALMRFLLSHHLDGAQIKTRQILIDLMQL